MFSMKTPRALLVAALLRLQPRQPLCHQPAHQQLLQLLQHLDKASHRRQVLELSQLAALLPLDAAQKVQLVKATLQALHRVASTPFPKNSGSRRQTVQSIRSRQRRR
jgi:hypothetical protein